MEKKTSYTILDEMRQAVSALRSQLDAIEGQMSALETAIEAELAEKEVVVAEEEAVAPSCDQVAAPVEDAAAEAVQDMPEEPVAEPVPDLPEEVSSAPVEEVVAEVPVAPVPVPEPVSTPAPVEEEIPSDTLVMEEAPEPIDLGISDFSIVDIDMPAANINEAEAVNVKPAVMDVMAEKCAWKTDMPGTPVKNVLSAISLNDRILFVNTLFGEDAALFQQTIQIFNTYTTLAEAEEYVRTNFRNWDMNSDVVYRFMMAARRKLK